MARDAILYSSIAAAAMAGAFLLLPDTALNGCPHDPNPGRYGSAVEIDGIYISGSPEFVGRTVTAIQRVWRTPSYHYIQRIHSIQERYKPGIYAEIYRGATNRVYVVPAAAERGCTLYGSTLVHEGAHARYGSGHKRVYAAQAQALREMKEPIAAIFAEVDSVFSSETPYAETRQAWGR